MVRAHPEFIITDRGVLEGYMNDAAGGYSGDVAQVEGLARPQTLEDMTTAMAYVHSQRLPMTFSAGKTGLTGGKNPTTGGIVISTENMLTVREDFGNDSFRDGVRQDFHTRNWRSLVGRLWREVRRRTPSFVHHTSRTDQGEIRYALDTQRREAIFSPGVSLQSIDDVLANHGLWLPPNPTARSAHGGACIVNNSSGSRTFRYGPMRDRVTYIKVGLADGDTVTIRRGERFAWGRNLTFHSDSGRKYSVKLPTYHMPAIKNAAGLYSKKGMDLIDLFIGSEGILGSVLEFGVHVEKKREIETRLYFFETDSEAYNFVTSTRRHRDKFLSIEYFDSGALAIAPRDSPEGARAAIQIEYFADDDEARNLLMREEGDDDFAGYAFDHNATQIWDNDGAIIKYRGSIPKTVNEAVRAHGQKKLGTDLAVPHQHYATMHSLYLDAVGRFATFCREDAARHGQAYEAGTVHHAIWGHIGDDHVHVNFIPRNDREAKKAAELYLELVEKAMDYGGTVSAEHGVGKKELTDRRGRDRPYLEFMYGAEGLAQITAVKRALDPLGLVNPGNMVPSFYQSAA